jgi:hypothetical protein
LNGVKVSQRLRLSGIPQIAPDADVARFSGLDRPSETECCASIDSLPGESVLDGGAIPGTFPFIELEHWLVWRFLTA